METAPANILVIGSSNTDMVVRTHKFPVAGETILGDEFFMTPGGKGANQAVAAARLGADVQFLSKIGKDVFGSYTLAALNHEGISTAHLVKTGDHPTGIALITVNAAGENTIVVASGANMQLLPEDIPATLIDNAGIILMQLEIPLPTIEFVIKKANSAGKKVVLNPAPATTLPSTILNGLFLLTPNESEAEILTGLVLTDLSDLKRAGNFLLKKGVHNVVITLGERGAFLMNGRDIMIVPSPLVSPVDTTAAGDVFNGALVTALAQGALLPEACDFACRAAAISVTRVGSQSSAPYKREV